MKKLLCYLGFAIALVLSPLAAVAATITVPAGHPLTLKQNEHSYFDVRDFQTFSLAFTNAAFYSGGNILVTTDATNTNRPWEAKHLFAFGLTPENPTSIFVWNFDTVQTFARYFVVNTYGEWKPFANASAPAPVPLPAAGGLLLAGIVGLAALKRRRQRLA